MRLARLLAPLLAVTLVTGCINNDPVEPVAFSDTGVVETTTFNAAFGINLSDAAWVRLPTGLYYRVIAPPTDTTRTATAGQRITVNYAGWLVNGQQFDAGTYAYVLGSGDVIAGWDQGLAGMRVGEQRILLIPAALGYGVNGRTPIPGNATLIFQVQLAGIQ